MADELDRARTVAARLEQELAECRRHLSDLVGAIHLPPLAPADSATIESIAKAASDWLFQTPDGPPPVADLIDSVFAHGHHDDCAVYGGESWPGPCSCPLSLAYALTDVEAREDYYAPEAQAAPLSTSRHLIRDEVPRG